MGTSYRGCSDRNCKMRRLSGLLEYFDGLGALMLLPSVTNPRCVCRTNMSISGMARGKLASYEIISVRTHGRGSAGVRVVE